MNKRVNFIIGIGVILAIAGCIAYAAAIGAFAAKKAVDPTESIRQFIGDPDAIVIFEEKNKNVLREPYDTYRVNGDHFTVDSDTGSVTGASFFSVPMTKSKKIYLQQAENSAREFAVRHYKDFVSRNMQLTESKELDYGVGGIEYSYTWSEQSMNINTTNTVRISTNTEGRVLSYYSRDKTPPTIEPGTIRKDQAIETATRYVIEITKINNITSKEASAQPAIMADHREIWDVNLEVRFRDQNQQEDHRGGWVYVDAITGEVVKYEPCQ